MSNEAFAKIEAGQKLLTFAPLLAILRAGTLERSFAGRRPGRPCIDEQVQAVIRRMAMENRLWGAPRIHGKLLKLGTPSQNARCRVISRPTQGSVTGVACIPREPPQRPGMHFDVVSLVPAGR